MMDESFPELKYDGSSDDETTISETPKLKKKTVRGKVLGIILFQSAIQQTLALWNIFSLCFGFSFKF